MPPKKTTAEPPKSLSPLKKGVMLALGGLFFALGVLGAFLPIMPTTPFLLVASFFFAKSSPRLHQALIQHKTLGPPLRHWQEHGAISRKAKVLSVLLLTLSIGFSLYLKRHDPFLPWIMALVYLSLVGFILTRPTPPD